MPKIPPNQCILDTPLISPCSAYLSARFAKSGTITINKKFLNNITSIAIGSPNATAIPASLCPAIAKAVPRIPPDTTSGGSAAPTPTAPISASSIVAPITHPACISPIASPTKGPNTNGLV